MTEKPLFIIDITAQLFRMYFAGMQRFSPDGIEVGAVWGVCTALQKILRHLKPHYLAAVFDSKEPTFRSAIDPSYKANRGLPPEDLVPQFEIVYQMCQKIGIACYKQPGVEADDLMASLALAARKQGIPSRLLTIDKDLNQIIVDEEPTIWRYDMKKELLINADVVQNSMGVKPAQCVDYMALVGDSVDNIPGVKGIGAKTAAILLQHYPTLEAIFADLEGVAKLPVRGAKGVAKKLKDGEATALHCRKLLRLKTDIELQQGDLKSILKWSGPQSPGEMYLQKIGLGRYFNAFKSAF